MILTVAPGEGLAELVQGAPSIVTVQGAQEPYSLRATDPSGSPAGEFVFRRQLISGTEYQFTALTAGEVRMEVADLSGKVTQRLIFNRGSTPVSSRKVHPITLRNGQRLRRQGPTPQFSVPTLVVVMGEANE